MDHHFQEYPDSKEENQFQYKIKYKNLTLFNSVINNYPVRYECPSYVAIGLLDDEWMTTIISEHFRKQIQIQVELNQLYSQGSFI